MQEEDEGEIWDEREESPMVETNVETGTDKETMVNKGENTE